MKLAAIEQIAQAFASHHVRFLVVGGLAVAAHGYIRYIADLYLVIQLDPANVEHAFAALEEIGYRPNVPVTGRQFGDVQLREKWIAEKGMVVLNFWSDRPRDTSVDVFVSEPFDFDCEFDTGLQQELVPGVLFHFPRLETLIEMKLRAGRPKDLNDVDALRKSQSA